MRHSRNGNSLIKHYIRAGLSVRCASLFGPQQHSEMSQLRHTIEEVAGGISARTGSDQSQARLLSLAEDPTVYAEKFVIIIT